MIKMEKYEEISEKERILREILRSSRLLTGKREFLREGTSERIAQKGGLSEKEGRNRELIIKIG